MQVCLSLIIIFIQLLNDINLILIIMYLIQTTAEELEEFASTAGDVKFLRMGEIDPATGLLNALVEFTDQSFIPSALQLHSKIFKGFQVK